METFIFALFSDAMHLIPMGDFTDISNSAYPEWHTNFFTTGKWITRIFKHKFSPILLERKSVYGCYHRIITLPQVKPLPKAAKTTRSPFLILPASQASVKAIGMDAAVVFPYFWILLYTLSSGNPIFLWMNCEIRRFA